MTTSTWTIDAEHSVVEFAVKHMVIATVKGHFSDVKGTIELDEEDPTRSRVDVEIAAASIDTRQRQRDAHLRSADFFDVERHPLLTFRSRRVERTDAGGLRVVGDLTLRGTTREVALDATWHGRNRDAAGVERVAYSAQTVIDRTDFGLTWNAALETGGVLVGNEIRIALEIQGIAQQAERQAA